jgi:hypothetical protein
MAKEGLLGTTALVPPAVATAAPQPSPDGLGLGAPPTVAPPAPEQQPNVTPEEQAEYDQVVNNAYKMLYEDVPLLLENIGGHGDPVTGIATVVANAMSRITDSAVKDGRKFSDGVILNAGVEVLEDLADLAAESGIHDFTPDELESATYLAAETYRSLQQESGNIDPNQAVTDMAALQQAEADGNLEQMLPGVAEHFAAKDQVAAEAEAEAGAPPPDAPGPQRQGLVG